MKSNSKRDVLKELFSSPEEKLMRKVNDLLDKARSQVRQDPLAARRELESALKLLRPLSAANANRNSLMGEILSEQAQVDLLEDKTDSAVELLLQSRSLGTKFPQHLNDFLAIQLALALNTESIAIEIYLQSITPWSGKSKPQDLRPVYEILERACSISVDMDSKSRATRLELCAKLIEIDSAIDYPYYYRGILAFFDRLYPEALKEFEKARKRLRNSSDTERLYSSQELEYHISFSEASGLRANGDLQKAAAGFIKCFQQNPERFDPHLQAGVSLVDICEAEEDFSPPKIMQKRLEFAVTALVKACDLDAASDQALHYLGRAYYLQHDAERAVERFEAAIQLHPDAKYYIDLARALWRAGRLDDAKVAARNALKQDPNYLKAHHFLAGRAQGENDFIKARHEYEEIIKISPSPDLNALYGLANCLYQSKDYPGAIAQLCSIPELSEEARFLLARCFSLNNDFVNAEKQLQQLIFSSPENGEYYYYLGCALAHQLRYDEALNAFTKAEEYGAKQNVALPRAVLFERMERIEDAELEYQKALNGENSETAALRLAELYTRFERVEDAIKTLNSAKRTPTVLTTLGLLLEENGNCKEVDEVFLEALAADPENGAIACKYGILLSGRADIIGAISYLELALSKGHDTRELHYHLGLSQLVNGDADSSLAHLIHLSDEPGLDQFIQDNHLNAAMKAIDESRYHVAISHWQQAMRLGADATILRTEIGKAWLALAIELEQADQNWKESIANSVKCNPGDPQTIYASVMADIISGKVQECSERLEANSGRLTQPLKHMSDYLIAIASIETGDYSLAERKLNMFDEQSKDAEVKIDTIMPRACLLAKKENWDAAADLLLSQVR